eukprot:gene14610-biopygen4362
MDAEESHPRRSQSSTKGVPPPRFSLDEYADVTEARHVVFAAIIEEPATIQKAFNSEYSAQWKEATDSEYQSLTENQTWELVKPPKDRKAIGCKEFNQPELVKLGDGHTVEARGSGRAQITMETSHNKQLTIEMDNVLYVPKLACNLFSVRAVTQKGLIV